MRKWDWMYVNYFPLLEPNRATSSLELYILLPNQQLLVLQRHRLYTVQVCIGSDLATCTLTCYINLSPISWLTVLTLPSSSTMQWINALACCMYILCVAIILWLSAFVLLAISASVSDVALFNLPHIGYILNKYLSI